MATVDAEPDNSPSHVMVDAAKIPGWSCNHHYKHQWVDRRRSADRPPVCGKCHRAGLSKMTRIMISGYKCNMCGRIWNPQAEKSRLLCSLSGVLDATVYTLFEINWRIKNCGVSSPRHSDLPSV